MFVRSKLEHSAVVWGSALTQEEKDDLERIQKAAVKVISKNLYSDYEKTLEMLNMKTLNQRRDELSLKFAKNCLKNEKVKSFFPINNHSRITRNPEKFKVNFANTKRYGNSTIPYLQRSLNKDEQKKKQQLKKFLRKIGVNCYMFQRTMFTFYVFYRCENFIYYYYIII